MTSIHFLPWVGSAYAKGIKIAGISRPIKVMVLGESHYCADVRDAVPQITNDIIRYFLQPDREAEGWMNTYTKFERALAGKVLSQREREQMWNSLLFYNYVQTPMSGARVAPTKQEFRDSDGAFFEVLERYRPDCIIVWGVRLYNSLPDCGGALPDLTLPNGDSTGRWGYRLKDGSVVPVLSIYHPSAGFDTDYWHRMMHQFFQEL